MHLFRFSTKGFHCARVVGLLGIAFFLLSVASQAQAPLVLICESAKFSGKGYSCTGSVYAGVPGSTVYTVGLNFGADTVVDVYFDDTEIAPAVSNGYGVLILPTVIPATALEGEHWITAIQRSNDAAAQEPFQVETNWSAFRYSATHRSDNTYETMLGPGNVGDIDIAWSYLTGGPVYSSPAQLDTVPITEHYYPAAASFDTYFGSLDGYVYDVDAVAGTEKWKFLTYGWVTTSPAVNNGTLYVGSADTNLYALNAITGAYEWAYATNGNVFSSPAVANGKVYFGSNDFNVYAVNATGGGLVWSFPTTNYVGTSPAVSNNLVYVGSDDAILYALNANTGAQTWNVNLTASCIAGKRSTRPLYVGSQVLSSVAVSDGVVYVGYNNGMYAFNGLTGAPIWSNQLSNLSCGVPTTPAVANDVLYVGAADNNIYALNARTGSVMWSYSTGGPIDSSPAVANGVVYVGSSDGNVYALNASTGALLWDFATGGNVESSPIIANGTVYVGSDDGNFYAFNLAGGAQVRTKVSPPNPATLRSDSSPRPAAAPEPNLTTQMPIRNIAQPVSGQRD
jgi:outer membrane protein assembly factor BamB